MTPSYDAETEEQDAKPWEHLSADDIGAAVDSFQGTQQQRHRSSAPSGWTGPGLPPGPRRAEVELPPATVTVHEIAVLAVRGREVDIRVRCSKGHLHPQPGARHRPATGVWGLPLGGCAERPSDPGRWTAHRGRRIGRAPPWSGRKPVRARMRNFDGRLTIVLSSPPFRWARKPFRSMKLTSFKFDLPKGCSPLPRQGPRWQPPDGAAPEDRQIEHKKFRDVLDYFDEGDVFVLNNTRVFLARMWGNRRRPAPRSRSSCCAN